MVDSLAEAFKTSWVPGSATFFVFALIFGVILLYAGRRASRWGKRFLLALALLGYSLSTPLVASGLVQLLSQGYGPLDLGERRSELEAIVILGGGGSTYRLEGYQLNMLSGPTSLRLLEGMRLYEAVSPDWVILSGGTNERAGVSIPESETMATHLIEMGVPANKVLIEGSSSNTRDQAINIPQLLEQQDITRYVLVTSPTHMRRADLSFRAVSSAHLTSTAPLSSESKSALGWSPLPSAEALEISRDVFRELVGLMYYFLRGWI